MKSLFAKLPLLMFFVSIIGSSFLYGAYAQKQNLFPIKHIKAAARAVADLRHSKVDEVIYTDASDKEVAVTYAPDRISPGLILVMGVAKNRENVVRVIDRTGAIVHEIRPNWFEIWGDDEGSFPEERRPKKPPGAVLHGIEMLPGGDIVANFERLSTFRMNLCGEVIWKLDNSGHHSVHLAEDGVIWVSAELPLNETPNNHYAASRNHVLQRISQDGKILESIPVIDILRDNDLEGLLTISSTNNFLTEVRGDTLHLNDIETFPSGLRSELFKPGDVMFSLRNINTIVVMDAKSRKIKFRSTGEVLRHHDPDFMDNDRISIFDNRNLMPTGGADKQSSRILEIDARTGSKTIVVDGAGKERFFSQIMGTHQRLPNGNLLINSSDQGRIMETLPDGTLVWAYRNIVAGTKVGRVTMALVLPPQMDEKFFHHQRDQCRPVHKS